jgi:Rrf2 family cysteine metabolism transcriptional repressor
LDLARRQGAAPIPLKDIAQGQGISLYYLEQIVTPLAAAGVVRSSRGASGGIQLAKPPQEIRLSEILRLVEGSLVPVDCVANPEICPRSKLCVTREVWVELYRAISAVLDSTTLQDLVKRQERKERIEGSAVK